MYHCFVNDLS